jgi:hypothetical protein
LTELDTTLICLAFFKVSFNAGILSPAQGYLYELWVARITQGLGYAENKADQELN